MVGIDDHRREVYGLQTLSHRPRFRPLSIELQAVSLYSYRTGLAILDLYRLSDVDGFSHMLLSPLSFDAR